MNLMNLVCAHHRNRTSENRSVVKQRLEIESLESRLLMDVSVAQYNVQFLSPVDGIPFPGHWPNTRARAEDIGRVLACNDIVVLNETTNDTRRDQIIASMERFGRDCGKTSLFRDFRMFDAAHGPDLEGLSVRVPLLDDEVTVVSRFPIESVHYHIYSRSSGLDAAAAKGIVHVRLWRGTRSNEYIDVFATHLQAGESMGSREVRASQVAELAEFVMAQADPKNPVFILGDFNIDGMPAHVDDLASEYVQMMIGLGTTAPSGFRFRDAGLGTGATNGGGDERLDYIFFHPGASVALNTVNVNYHTGFGSGGGPSATLSDHAAVTAEFRWPEGPIPAYPATNRPKDVAVRFTRLTATSLDACAGVRRFSEYDGVARLWRGDSDGHEFRRTLERVEGLDVDPNWRIQGRVERGQNLFMSIRVTEIDTHWCGGREDRVALDVRETEPIIRIDTARGLVFHQSLGSLLGRVGQPITLKGTHGDETANITFVVDVSVRGFPGCDFNGDGYHDLAVGDPRETVGTAAGAGAVTVTYGGRLGLSTLGSQYWHQDSSFTLSIPPFVDIYENIEDTAEAYDQFGASLACGDFNRDGYSDLAIGVPDEDIGTVADAGAVHVLYGSRYGLTIERDQFWHQDRSGVAENAEVLDLFGATLASGDFNGDGFDDLAIGVPGESIGSVRHAGAVQVLFGSASGLQSRGDQLLSQNATSESGGAEVDDEFGRALTVGDFNGDGLHDLAIAAPYEDLHGIADAGFVHTFHGSRRRGLVSWAGWHQGKRSISWDSSSPRIADTSEAYDFFGGSLSSGDYNQDGFDDLAIGVPGESMSGVAVAGAVHVLYGTARWGLWYDGNSFWHQDREEIADSPEPYDGFGGSLASGDFNGDGWDDLAIGVIDESIGSIVNAGGVHVLFGSLFGIQTRLLGFLPCRSSCPQFWHQDRLGGGANVNEGFGTTLAGGDFNNDGADDLAIGVRSELTRSGRHVGAVHILHGDFWSGGLTDRGARLLTQDDFGSRGFADRAGDQFGSAFSGGV